MQVLLLIGLMSGSLVAQLPATWQQRLHSKDPKVREAAVKELGVLDPTPAMPAAMLAAGLVEALRDEDLEIRDRAAKFLGGNRPSDIAVPALVQALRAAEKDFDWAMKTLTQPAKKPEPGHSRVMDGFKVLMLPPYADSILFSLRDHQDDRAVTGVAETLAGWKLDRVPGTVIQAACKELCLRGTAPALDGVVDCLARAKRYVDDHPSAPIPDTRNMKPAEEVRWMYGPIAARHLKEIIADLDAAVLKAGIQKPPGFDGDSPAAWKDLLRANASSIPKRLADRPASRPGAASRSAGK